MNESIIGNLSSVIASKCPSVINVKDFCYGEVGVELLIMTLMLIVFNFLCLFFWRKIRIIQLTVNENKKFDLVWLIPLVNLGLLTMIFVYAYNAF